MAPSAPSASFASLPPELRVEIFRYVLASERAFRGEIRTRVHVKRRRERSFPGRYLRFCKLFNAEAAPILYSQHRFYFRTLYDGMVFMRRIGRTNLSCVKGLHFGTFWITASEGRRLWGVYSSTDWCRKDVVDEIQQFAPSLTHLQFTSVGPYYEHRSFLKMLDGCRYAMEKLPKLTNVYYSRSNRNVVMSTEAMNAESPTYASTYSGFDVEEMIKDVKAQLFAARSAGARSGAVTRRWIKAAREAREAQEAAQAASQTTT